MPRISESFTVNQSAARVWEFFQDVPQVVTCLPGLELAGQPQPEVFVGRIKVKLGAVSATFEGEATIIETDHVAHVSRIKGRGVDKKGGSRAQAEFTYRLAAVTNGTQVTVDADINLTGPLAQFGRTGILNEVARELTAQFATNLEAKLAAGTAPTPSENSAHADTAPIAALDAGRLLRALLHSRWRALLRWLCKLFKVQG